MEYYISHNNEKRGPYSLTELKSRGLSAETLVMAEDSSEWTPAWQVEELRPYINTARNGAGTEPQEQEAEPVDGTAETVEGYQTAEPLSGQGPQYAQPVPPQMQKPPRKGHGGCLIGVIVAIVLGLALLIVTCPDEEAHQKKLSNTVTTSVNEFANSDSVSVSGYFGKVFQSVSNIYMGKIADAAVKNLVKVDNYFVCSVGKVRLDGKNNIVSVGLLGHVFTTDSATLQKAAKKYYDKAERQVQADMQKKAEQFMKENVLDPLSKEAGKMLQEMLGGALEDFGLAPGTPDDESDGEPDDADSI